MNRLNSNLFRSRKNRLPIIRQDQFSECGHACVAMLCNFHGHHIDLFSLREISVPSSNGSTLLDLVKLLEQLKLKSRALRVNIDDLKKVRCPAILHWNMNHFVVLKSIGQRYAIIHDPAAGIRTVPISELATSFTGIVLEIEKSESFEKISCTNQLKLSDLFKNIIGFKSSLVLLLILSLIIEVLILLNPIFLQYVTDNVVSTGNINNLYAIATGIVILTIGHTFTEYIRSNFVVYLTNKLSEYFSSGVMTHLLKLPLQYFEKRHRGDILSRFQSIQEIQSKITTDSINTILDGFVILLSLAIMFIYSGFLTLLALISLVFYVLLRTISYHHLKTQTEISVTEHANVNSKFLEIIQSIMSVKIYTKEEAMYRGWKNNLINAMNSNIAISKLNIVYSTVSIFLFNIENICVICLGASLIVKNQFSVGMLVAFLAYRQTLVNKSISFIHKIFEYKLISVQINRVADILLHPIDPEDKLNIIKKPIEGSIKAQNIMYSYPGNSQPILNNISFEILQGEKVVIIGPSGIGKTTFLKILLGLIPPTEGQILIDNIPLEYLGCKYYREAIASVMQEDSLISGSILDNITFMDIKIDLNRVYEVSAVAKIHDDILLMPMAYETLIGDMGSALSGGQKQRVLLARALYKQPKILFLDEATSHLDVDTEIQINNSLKMLQITQIVIAHRQETIRMADRVFDLSV